MATLALGKLKLNFSDGGLAFRWGEGEIHRFGKGDQTRAEGEQEPYDDYAEDRQYDDAGDGYDDYDDRGEDRYADDYQDGYDDYDDDRDAGDYDDDRDDGYDDRDQDDYDDGYGDDRGDYDDYDDRDQGDYDDGYGDRDDYDDRYSSEDADGYDQDGGDYGDESPLMQYVDQNNWVTYALLVLLPPLGIYLLWRKQMFEKPIRWILTAVAALWFIIALFLIFSRLFGTQDNPKDPTVPLNSISPTLAPTVSVTPSPRPDDTEEPGTSTETETEATAGPTPIVSTLTGDYVYSPPSGQYYHSTNTCENISEEMRSQLSRVSVAVAENSRRQVKCPVCFTVGAGENMSTYYGRRDGKYYHLDPTCSGLKNATTLTEEAAKNWGLTACPVCVTKTSTEIPRTKLVNNNTTDKSNIKVWYRPDSTNYHLTKDCRNMTGATQHSLKDALLAGKTACATCCPTAGSMVYTRTDSTYYHVQNNCSGMKNATQVTLAEALVLGKAKCPTCIGAGGVNTGTGTATNANGEVVVYGTKNGKYYHTNPTCTGMQNAQQYTLKAMLQAGRAACPTCAASANTTVYATANGTYYHSYATCSGMQNAVSGTLAQALAYGKQRCPRCWNTKTAAANANGALTTTAASATATAENTYVYATKDGTWYHLKDNCTGMKNASRVTLRTAIEAGKTACPTCATPASRIVFSTDNGKYYHSAATCEKSGMKNGTSRTLAQALMLKQTACPDCMGKDTTTTTAAAAAPSIASATKNADGTTTVVTTGGTTVTVKNTYKSGTSGLKVYATAGGQYFHTRSDCGGMENASLVSLETALNYGKTACPTCASTASRTVYATEGGKYYHYYKADAGAGAKAGTLAQALALGYDACPVCVTRTTKPNATSSNKYKSGTSGVMVYATLNGTYYHSKANCSGMTTALHITLETALNYGKTACPTCMAVANTRVYGTAKGTYYHYNKTHAGTGALTSTLAVARATGLKPCPTCVKGKTAGFALDTGKANGAVSTVYYSADASTRVYIELGSLNIYYHKASRCAQAEFSGGTGVTLQYAKDWGYKACPFCNPPTDVSTI